jgi:hypothetical protein
MPDNSANLVDNLERLAHGIKRALERREGGRSEFIEGTIDAAIKLHTARHDRRFTSHRAFGQWCEANGIGNDVLKKNERAALIEMAGRPDEFRAMFAASTRNSIQTFHTDEWRVRYPNARITVPRPQRQTQEGQPRRRNSTGRQRPQEDRARDAVRESVVAGEPARARAVGEEIGVSHVIVEQAVAVERGRLELLQELDVDPATLSMTARARLEVATRLMERRLQAEHAARMRAVDEEVRRRVVEEGREYLAMMQAREAEAQQQIDLSREYMNNRRPLFTNDEYRTILMCLHPDGQRTADKLAEAFRLFNAKKLQLTGAR